MNGDGEAGDHEPAGEREKGPSRNPAAGEALIMLGRITAHQGLNGWVRVHSDTEPRENIVSYARWSIRRDGGEWRRVEVLDGRAQGKTIIARLAGVERREDAQPLIGCEIAVRREELPVASPDEYYWTDLIGMAVATVKGDELGTVSRLFETGANDVLVVADEREGAKAGTEILVPWVRPDVVVDVDATARRIVVDWDPDY